MLLKCHHRHRWRWRLSPISFFLCCLSALTPSDLWQRIENQNFSLYRRGKTIGIKDVLTGRKYLLKTLGLDQVFLDTVKRLVDSIRRGREIEELQQEKFLTMWKGLGFREDFKDILSSREQTQREKEIEEILKLQRKREREI